MYINYHNKNNGFIPHHFLQKKSGEGFTLVETLVAIAVLVGVVAAPMFIASQGIKTAAFARDQVIAAYLAQDAVEFVIAKKKQNTLDEVLQISNGLLFNLDVCASPDGCVIDTTYPLIPLQVEICFISGCPPLKFNSVTGAYGYNDAPDPQNWTESRFTRKITIDSLSNNEAVLAVTIFWRNTLIQKSFTIKTNIYKTVL